MINPLLPAIEFENLEGTFEVRALYRHFKPEDYAFVYFGRRYLTEKEHLVLVRFGVKATLPSYEGGVGYILLKDNLTTRSLTCKQCSSACDSLESFMIHENDSTSYVCSFCNVKKFTWEEVKTK